METTTIPVVFELDSIGIGGALEATGAVHFFCSPECRERAQPAVWNPCKAGEQPLIDIELGTVCETCGKLVAHDPRIEVEATARPFTLYGNKHLSEAPILRVMLADELYDLADFSISEIDDLEVWATAERMVSRLNSHQALVDVAEVALSRIDAIGQDPPYPQWAVGLAEDLRAALALVEKGSK